MSKRDSGTDLNDPSSVLARFLYEISNFPASFGSAIAADSGRGRNRLDRKPFFPRFLIRLAHRGSTEAENAST
jgi:hypothetical protein